MAGRLNLQEPEGRSVSSSRVIFVGAQVGARTVPRSLCSYHPATRPFHSICTTKSTSVRAPTATAPRVSWVFARFSFVTRKQSLVSDGNGSDSTHWRPVTRHRRASARVEPLAWLASSTGSLRPKTAQCRRPLPSNEIADFQFRYGQVSSRIRNRSMNRTVWSRCKSGCRRERSTF